MAQAFDQLPEQTKEQMACVYATLLLHDDGQELSEANVKKVITASGVKVQPYWPALFLKAIQGRDLNTLLTVGGGSGGEAAAPAQGGAAPAKGAPAGGKPAEKPKEPEKPAEEEANVSMGGLFD